MELVEVDGEIVSSSHIRALVAAGEVEHAAALPRGPVPAARRGRAGDRRGRDARLPDRQHRPRRGARLPRPRGLRRAGPTAACAAVSVGVRPTFGTGLAVLVEAYLLDFDGDLYGRSAAVDFLARLRGERRFETVRGAGRRRCTRRRRRDRAELRRDRDSASLSRRMTLTQERKQELISQFGDSAHRHRQDRGPGRAADRAHQRAHRAPAHPRARITTRAAAC